MFFFGKKRDRRSFTAGEQQILDLLLRGESPVFAALRRQCAPPLLLWLERESSPTVHTLTFIFDASVRQQFTIGEWNSGDVDDLFVIDRRLPEPLRCVGSLTHGILGNVICTAPSPVRWPKDLKVDDWFYAGPNGERSQTRLVDWEARFAEASKPRPLPPDVQAALPQDYVDYMNRPGRRLATACATLLHPADLYFLDDNRVEARLLVFARAVDGNVFAFAPGEAAVHEIDADTGDVTRRAASFTEWLALEPQDD